MNDRRVFFEAAPVALVGKRFAARDAHRRENAPAADDSGLTRREANLVDGLQAVVVKNIAMNHCGRPWRWCRNRIYPSIVPDFYNALGKREENERRIAKRELDRQLGLN